MSSHDGEIPVRARGSNPALRRKRSAGHGDDLQPTDRPGGAWSGLRAPGTLLRLRASVAEPVFRGPGRRAARPDHDRPPRPGRDLTAATDLPRPERRLVVARATRRWHVDRTGRPWGARGARPGALRILWRAALLRSGPVRWIARSPGGHPPALEHAPRARAGL